jgi:hypothetical protein
MANLTIHAPATLQQMFSKWESACNDLVSYANTPPLTDSHRGALEADAELLRRKLEPAGNEELTKAVAKLSMGCKHGKDEAFDRRAFIAILMEHVMGYPIDIIREACYEWTHGNTFFPSIAEFCALCEPKFQKRRGAYMLMRQALAADSQKRAEAAQESERRAQFRDPKKRAELQKKFDEARARLSESKTIRFQRKQTFVPLPDDERERLLLKIGSR